MKRHLGSFIALPAFALALVVTGQWSGQLPAAAQSPSSGPAAPKYIFIFLADGGGLPHLEITRLYNRYIYNQGMVITDKIMKQGALGLFTTHAADSLSTDSAAAATALASGCKAKIDMLGICADGSVGKTAMEIAREKGMRIGLATTATIYDASPAGFVAHVSNRKNYGAIVDQYLQAVPDLLLGGGREQFLPQTAPGSQRKDDRNVISEFVAKGYGYASSKDELERIQKLPLLGLFGVKDLDFELDRGPGEPSLFDMTRTAIRLLADNNRRGFVAFIESENVDSAGHLTDVASVIQAYRELDRAVGLAYDFYEKHPRETLILVTADHETGGLGFTLGLKDLTGATSANMKAGTQEDLKKIQSITISFKKAAAILGPRPTSDAVDNLMKDYFKGFTLAPDIKEAILKQQPLSRTLYVDATANALGSMVANNTQAYWQTSSHTNQPVFAAALGVGAEKFRGYQDNTDFGKNLKALIGARGRP